jgi:ubiquinone/menaquinone biosynthesis C-methylase UbiE
VLDVGCGTGTLAIEALRREPRVEMTGLDGDPVVLSRARAKAGAAGADVRFDQALSDRMPYADASFDVVLSSLFFHHLVREVKERTIREIARVLRPGGRLHVADWGPAGRAVTAAVFLAGVRLFDGLAETRDNVRGELPRMFAAGGLSDARELGSLRVVFGRLAFYSARRAAA